MSVPCETKYAPIISLLFSGRRRDFDRKTEVIAIAILYEMFLATRILLFFLVEI